MDSATDRLDRRLRLPKNDPLAGDPLGRLLDVDGAIVDVRPAQTEQLTAAHSREERQTEKSRRVVSRRRLLTVPSASVPTIDAAFLERERREMAAELYAPEYECQFGRGAGGLFTVDMVDSTFKESA